MSNTLNLVVLVGRLGKDPEVRYTKAGQAVANFSLATDESYTDNNGEKQKKTEWHNIVCWGKAVENFIAKYIHKGDMVHIEGRLQTRAWKDKNEETRYTTEVNVTNIGIVASSTPAETRTAAPASRSTSKPAARPAQRQTAPEPEADDTDAPF